MTDLTGDLLREVSRVQHDKTLMAVRDLIETLELKEPDRYNSRSYGSQYKDRTAQAFKSELLTKLQQLREEGRNG